MHPPDRVALAVGLAEQGLNASEIARETGIPRATVRDWLAGKLPTRARDAGDSCPTCGDVAHDFRALPHEYVYLLGMYLGDGCISSHRRHVYRLRIFLDVKYPGVIEECADAIALVRPKNKVSRQLRGGGFETSSADSCVEIACYSKSWPCFFPQHGPGRKHYRSILLTDWQQALVDGHPELLLRGLVHSDGCRFMNTGTNWRHPRYVFTNMSADIRRIFCRTCEMLELHWTTANNSIYVSKKKDVAILDTYIGPKC